MNVWPKAYFNSMFSLKEKNCLTNFLHLFAWCRAVVLPLLKWRALEPVWTWRRGGSLPLQLSVSLQVTWFPPGFHNPPPPWIPRGEKVITIIALPWHGAKHPEVREKDHWNDDVSELIKKDWFVWSSTMVNCVGPISYPVPMNEYILYQLEQIFV